MKDLTQKIELELVRWFYKTDLKLDEAPNSLDAFHDKSIVREEARALSETILKLFNEEIEGLAEKVETLDYYWQREHQDKTLVRLDDVLARIRSLSAPSLK